MNNKRNNNLIRISGIILVLIVVLVSSLLRDRNETETTKDLSVNTSTTEELDLDASLDYKQEDFDFDDNSQSTFLGDIKYGEHYYERDDVAAYIHLYEELPHNYITKEEADDIDWEVDDESGLVVGGNKFGNRERLLPEAAGRQYYEADLVEGYTTHRGPSRLVYSNDGLIFYTDDHYESFTQLY